MLQYFVYACIIICCVIFLPLGMLYYIDGVPQPVSNAPHIVNTTVYISSTAKGFNTTFPSGQLEFFVHFIFYT